VVVVVAAALVAVVEWDLEVVTMKATKDLDPAMDLAVGVVAVAIEKVVVVVALDKVVVLEKAVAVALDKVVAVVLEAGDLVDHAVAAALDLEGIQLSFFSLSLSLSQALFPLVMFR